MSERAFAVVGLFDTPDALLGAVAPAKAAGLGRIEAYTPYPVHGLGTALGLRRSPLGGMVMVMGILGAATAILFQWWASAVDYPIVTGGKAPYSWEAFVPIMFEMMVAFATFTAGLGMLLLLNRLPFFSHPLLASPIMEAVTRDRFGLAIEAQDLRGEGVAIEEARAVLLDAGAARIEVVAWPARPAPLTVSFLGRLAAGIVAACVLAGLFTYWTIKLFPILPPMVRMQDQPKLVPQRTSLFFADGRVQRLPVPGTVARGHLPYQPVATSEASGMVNPLLRSEAVLDRGRRDYGTHCAVCHGLLADGKGSLTEAYGPTPANLQSPAIRAYDDPRLYDVIVRGKNTMPSYAADLDEDARWSVVHYLRALQRAQNASEEDLR
jgi:mono/diheme cytochrome c family protein